jgi:hypothetical protein
MTDKSSAITSVDITPGAEISVTTLKKDLAQLASGPLPQEYKGMLTHIEETLPATQAACDNFYKSHSQMMTVTLDITDLTPIRSIKHTLAAIERTKSALAEAQINRRKNEIKIKKKQREIDACEDDLDREELEIEMIELMSNNMNIENSMKGAIRKMSFLMTQYRSVLDHIGKDHITEEDYEREEKRYHVMTALKQALNSARPRGGVIDEGNSIYLFDIGVNVAHAQAEVFNYLKIENELISQGQAPSHEMTMEWLEKCADKFQDCAEKFAESRGFKVLDEKSLAWPEVPPLLPSTVDQEFAKLKAAQED